MRKLKYPIGISDFAEMRNNGYYYIDKTNLIVDLLDKGPVEVTQITRPRRFGKIPWHEHSRKFSGHHAKTASRCLRDWRSPKIRNFAKSG